jgi:hypothetical protein
LIELRLQGSSFSADLQFSALPPTTDIGQHRHHVGKVPTCDIEDARRSKEKPPKGGSSIRRMIVDHAAINADFDFRRNAMKPTPAKPRIIIAQVEGSGTGATLVISHVPTATGLASTPQYTVPVLPVAANVVPAVSERERLPENVSPGTKAGPFPKYIKFELHRLTPQSNAKLKFVLPKLNVEALKTEAFSDAGGSELNGSANVRMCGFKNCVVPILIDPVPVTMA